MIKESFIGSVPLQVQLQLIQLWSSPQSFQPKMVTDNQDCLLIGNATNFLRFYAPNLTERATEKISKLELSSQKPQPFNRTFEWQTVVKICSLLSRENSWWLPETFAPQESGLTGWQFFENQNIFAVCFFGALEYFGRRKKRPSAMAEEDDVMKE